MVETMEESAQPIPNAQISVFRRDERGSVFIKEYRMNPAEHSVLNWMLRIARIQQTFTH